MKSIPAAAAPFAVAGTALTEGASRSLAQDVAVPLTEIPADSTCITFQRARAKEFLAAKT